MEALQQAFPEFSGRSIRVDPESMRASVIDVAQLVTQQTPRYTAQVVQRLLQGNAELYAKCILLKLPGRGPRTQVADAATLVEIIFLLPGKAAKQFRRKSAQYICRLLGGDESLIPEILDQSERMHGTGAQAFLLHAIADTDQVLWREKRMLTRDSTKRKSQTIRQLCPEAGAGVYAKNNGMLNKSVIGVTKSQFKKDRGIDKKNFTVRDYMTPCQLSMIHSGESASTGIFRMHGAASRDLHLGRLYHMMSEISDYAGVKRQCLEAPLSISKPIQIKTPDTRARIQRVTITDYFS